MYYGYFICLSSGQTIEGEAEDRILVDLEERWKDCIESEKIRFPDKKGLVMLDIYEIVAMSYIKDDKFKGEDINDIKKV